MIATPRCDRQNSQVKRLCAAHQSTSQPGLSGAGVLGQVGLLTHSFVVVRMPKDYFEVEEVQEHVSEEDKQAKVINCANVCFL